MISKLVDSNLYYYKYIRCYYSIVNVTLFVDRRMR